MNEVERYQKALYEANGRLVQLGQEPVKLEYEAGSDAAQRVAELSAQRPFTPDEAKAYHGFIKDFFP